MNFMESTMEVTAEVDEQIQNGSHRDVSVNNDKMDINTNSQEAFEPKNSLIKDLTSPIKDSSSMFKESSTLIKESLVLSEHKGDGDAPCKEEMDTSSTDNLEAEFNLQIDCADKIVNTVNEEINTADESTDKQEEQSSDETDTVKGEIVKISEAKGSAANNKDAESTENTETNANQTNPRKRKRCRPPKRVRKNKKQIVVQKIDEVENKQSDTTAEDCKDDVEYNVTISNLPNSWSYMELKNYIDTECGPVDEMEMIKDDKTGSGAIRLSYQTEAEAKAAIEKLKDKQVAGNKLLLEFSVVSFDSDSEAQSESVATDSVESNKKSWKPDLEPWEIDSTGTYGLKLQYLKSLNITPPLDKWFRCDKSELREVMEMAGTVQMIAVFTGTQRYANVMYSHPLEAVQAVSMLNNQTYYGKQLKVVLDRSPVDTVILPKGLNGIGQGLGVNGKPLKNIVSHYKRFKQNNNCSLNPTIFDALDGNLVTSASEKFQVKSINEFSNSIVKTPTAGKPAVTVKANSTVTAPTLSNMVTPKAVQYPKPATPQSAYNAPAPRPVTPARPNFTPSYQQQPYGNFTPQPLMNGGVQPHQGPQTLMPMMPQAHPMPQHPGMVQPYGPGPTMQPTWGQGSAPPGTGHMPQVPGHMPQGPGHMPQVPGQMAPGWQGPMGPRPPAQPGQFNNEPVKLLFSNLPLSTKFGLLCEKMSEWGLVVCIQLTTPGCAVVSFANRMQADACFKFYNGRSIENHIVHVQYG